jgi:hypothetical protein
MRACARRLHAPELSSNPSHGAVNAHGYIRFAQDIDLVIALDAADIVRAISTTCSISSGSERKADPMNEKRDGIDWSLTTWDGSRRGQLRHARTLALRERMEAMAGLADVARRIQELRARGALKSASERAGGLQAATSVYARSAAYDAGETT